MNRLEPCPSCLRHVRVGESACPFCNAALSLGDLPPLELPRSRLGRAATFAFGATLASATALAGCGGESQSGKEGSGGAAGSAAGSSASGADAGGSSQGGAGPVPLYGAPPAPGGTGNDNGGGSGSSGSAGQSSSGGGMAGPVYGAPPGGGVPIYGAAPAD